MGGVKAQSPVTEIGNSTDYGSYFDDGGGLPNDQNVLINNNPNAPRIIGAGFNEVINPTAELNFLGGEDNQVDGNGGVATANLLYGKDNAVRNSDYSVGFGSSNSIQGISNNSLAVGIGNLIDECRGCASIGIENRLKVPMMGGAFSIGAFHNNTNSASLLLGFGDDSNPLSSIGDRSISLGTYNNNSNIAFNTLNIRPPGISAAGNFDAPVTGIGTTSPSAKLEIQNKGENDNTAQALSVLNASGNPLFNVREDGWTGFSADPSAPYYFTETTTSPNGFSGGNGKANIVQDLGGFPFINPGNKWISVGERPPDNNDNQIAYGYAATWDNFAGNFFLDDVNQDGTKDSTISFQDAGVSNPDNASNRMRFIARDGDKIFQSGAFNELMSLYPEGEVAVGGYSDNSVTPDASRLEVKTKTTCNGCSNPEAIMEVLRNKNPSNTSGETVLSVRNDDIVIVNKGTPLQSGSATEEFQVNGSGISTGGFSQVSDLRVKEDTSLIKNPLKKVRKLSGVTYFYHNRNEKAKGLNFPKGRQTGVIAQQLKQVFPEAVSGSKEGLYAVNYDQIIPLLIETNKAQQKQIEKLKKKTESVKSLSNKVEKLQQQMQQMQNKEGAKRFKRSGDETLNQKTVTIGDVNQTKAMLLQNRPNPYSDKTTIPYYLPDDFNVANMLITDINGQLVKRVPLEQSGKGELTLRTEGLNAGQYIYSLIVDGRKVQSRKMVVNQ